MNKTRCTPRERLWLALNHQEPDKVPIDLGGHQTGIHVFAYQRVLDLLQIEDKQLQIYDVLQQLAVPNEAFLTRFQIDTRTLYPPATIIPASTDTDKESQGNYSGFIDNFGIFWGRDRTTPEKRLFYNAIGNPFSDFTTEQQIREYDWPKVEPRIFDGLRENARRMFETTDFALIGRSMGSLFQWSHYLFGLKKALRLLITNKNMIKAALDGLLNYFSEYATLYLKEVGEYIETVQITSDLTDQKGPMINPAIYRGLIKPYYAEFIKRIHQQANVKINYHCCGSAVHFIPDLLDIGINSLNPVQISADNMDPCNLKRSYGDNICFWGGLCNPQQTLPFGTPDQINREVERNMTCLKPNGGYIAASIHNIVHDVPAANIVAMLDAAIQHRNYP